MMVLMVIGPSHAPSVMPPCYQCAECSDFDLCVECFSVGVELHPHKASHKYR